MPASIKIVGLSETLRAMRKWLKRKSRVSVKFQAVKRRRPGVVIVRARPG